MHQFLKVGLQGLWQMQGASACMGRAAQTREIFHEPENLVSPAPGVQEGEEQLQVGLAEGGVQAHQLRQRQQRGRAQVGVGVAQGPARCTKHSARHANTHEPP